MSITKKVLAEKLSLVWAENASKPWEKMADLAAELLDADLAPELDPGSWWISKAGRPAYVDDEMDMRVIHADGDWMPPLAARGDGAIAEFVPARVIPEAEWEALRGAQEALNELDKLGIAHAERDTLFELAARLAAHGITREDVEQFAKSRYATPVLTENEVGEVWDSLPVELGGGHRRVSWTALLVNDTTQAQVQFAQALLAKYGDSRRADQP